MAAISLFNAIVGGASGGGSTPVSFKVKMDISLQGSITDNGSFPSSPISFWMPGTNVPNNTVGYVPKYDKVLGVVNFIARPDINTLQTITPDPIEEPYDGMIYDNNIHRIYFPSSIDYSQYVIYNPDVLEIADISIIRQDLVVRTFNSFLQTTNDKIVTSDDCFFQWDDYVPVGSMSHEPQYILGDRFVFKITPKDGTPSTLIIKTFLLNEVQSINYN